MKKITQLIMSFALLLCFAITPKLLAQAASSTWSLTTTTSSVVSGDVSSTDMSIGSAITGTIFGSSFGAVPNTSTGWMRVATTAPQLPATYNVNSYVEFTISPTANHSLTITSVTGNVAGGGTSNVKLAAYYSLDNFATAPGTNLGTCTYNGVANKTNTTGTPLALANTSSITTLAEGPIVYAPSIEVNNNQTLKVRFYVWSTSTNKYFPLKNIVISGTTVALSTDPIIAKTSGESPARVMESYAMTPVVYTYSNVADDANVSAEWYTDATYTTTKTAPSGLSLAKDVDVNTVTVSGTPVLTTAGTHYYKLIVNETNGNFIEDSVIVSAYVTPTPIITLSSGNAIQGLKAANLITDIVYNLTNVTGAGVTGLPAGLSGVFASTGGNSGTYTISGTVDGAVTAGLNNFVVTATPMAGYTGTDITSTGKIVVKSPDAKSICYLTLAAAPSATDTRLFPYLNEGLDYLVTVRQAAGTAPAASVYDAYDLIIANEAISSSNAELIALKTIDKPILSFKSFVYNSGSSRWNWGVADNGKANNGTVTVKQSSHPIFAGLVLTDGAMDILTASNTIGVQPVDVTNLVGRSIVLATAPKNASPYNMAVAIHEIPALIRGVTNSNFILIPFSDTSYGKISDAGLVLIGNAINYLIAGTQFVAPSLEISSFVAETMTGAINHENGTIVVSVPMSVDRTNITPVITLAGAGTTVTPTTAQNFEAGAVNYTVSDMISSKVYAVSVLQTGASVFNPGIEGVRFDGQNVINANNESLQVFDASGRLVVSSNSNISMSSYNKGIYIIRAASGSMKFALTR